MALILLAVTWPVATLNVPGPGVDQSFFTGMYLAAHGGYHFGTDLVSTYGPLGFLRWPAVFYAWTARLSISYVIVQQFLLCATLLWTLRRTFRTPVAFVIVLVIAGTIEAVGSHEVSLVIAFVWAVEALRVDANPLVKRFFPVAAGMLAGVEALVKLNTGFTVALVVAITCLAYERDRWRSLGLFAASFLVTASVCWFAADQTIGNVVDYITAARQMISGWSSVMMLTEPSSGWQLWAALAAAIVVWYCALEATKLQPRRIRIAVYLIWAIIAYSVFKEGFVRHESGHTSVFFATALGAALAFAWRRSQARTMLLSIGLLAMAFFGVNRNDPFAPVSGITSHVRSIYETAKVIVSSHEQDKLEAQARHGLRSYYGLDPRMLALVRNKSVQALASETSLIWAYQLHWQPVPVFEPFLAYTTWLDDRNRDALVSHGSDRIIRDTDPSIDDRNASFDAPAMEQALFCHYVQLAADRRWQVLGRVPNRCGRPTLLQSVRASWGDTVKVPTPRAAHAAVLVSISGAAPAGLDGLRTLLYRAHVRNIVLNRATVYRLVPDTASDGILISIPSGADYSPPFALAPNSQTISVANDPRQLFDLEFARAFGAKPAAPHRGSLNYAFFELPIR